MSCCFRKKNHAVYTQQEVQIYVGSLINDSTCSRMDHYIIAINSDLKILIKLLFFKIE
jgi:hypothetical protein